MNSLSLCVLFLVGFISIGIKADKHDVEFSSALAKHELEVDFFDYNFDVSATRFPMRKTCPDLKINQEDDISGCSTSKLYPPKKDAIVLRCYHFSDIFDKKPASVRLDVTECRGKHCNKVSIKKYRDFFINDNSVCIGRDKSQVCKGESTNSDCVRSYTLTVTGPDSCTDIKTSLIVAHSTPSIESLGERCRYLLKGKGRGPRPDEWVTCVNRDGLYQLRDGSMVNAIDVKVGDEVLVMKSDNTFDYSEVDLVHAHPSEHHQSKLWGINGEEAIFTDLFTFHGVKDDNILYIGEQLSNNPEPNSRLLKVGDEIYKYNAETKKTEVVVVNSMESVPFPNDFVYNVQVKVPEGEFQSAVVSGYVPKWTAPESHEEHAN